MYKIGVFLDCPQRNAQSQTVIQLNDEIVKQSWGGKHHLNFHSCIKSKKAFSDKKAS